MFISFKTATSTHMAPLQSTKSISTYSRGQYLKSAKVPANPLLRAISYYLERPPFIGFAGAVVINKVSCQLLSPIISLNFHSTSDDMSARGYSETQLFVCGSSRSILCVKGCSS